MQPCLSSLSVDVEGAEMTVTGATGTVSNVVCVCVCVCVGGEGNGQIRVRKVRNERKVTQHVPPICILRCVTRQDLAE